MPNDLRQDNYLVGATDTLYKLVTNIISGRHTLLLGDRGIGKSRLIQEASGILSGQIKNIDFSFSSVSKLRNQLSIKLDPNKYYILNITNSSPLSICLREIITELYKNNLLYLEEFPEYDSSLPFPAFKTKYLKKFTGNVDFINLIFFSIKHFNSRTFIFFLDDLDRITPSYQSLIEMLLSNSVLCAASSKIRDNLSLKKIWSSFAHLEIKPLNKFQASLLIDYFFKNYPIKALDKESLRNEILRSSHGNPFAIKNFLYHGSCKKYSETEYLWELRDTDENIFFNLGPVYVFILISATMLQIFSIGLYAREFYIYASAIGFIGYVIFRVFRNFFLFRPQRNLPRRQS